LTDAGDTPTGSVRSIVDAKIRQLPAGIILAETVDDVVAESRITDLTLVGVLDGLLLGKALPVRRFESTLPDHREFSLFPDIVVENRKFDHLRYGLLVALADGSLELRPERCETVIAPAASADPPISANQPQAFLPITDPIESCSPLHAIITYRSIGRTLFGSLWMLNDVQAVSVGLFTLVRCRAQCLISLRRTVERAPQRLVSAIGLDVCHSRMGPHP
jgi:hypothetical protein